MSELIKFTQWIQKAKEKYWTVDKGYDERNKAHQELLEKYGFPKEVKPKKDGFPEVKENENFPPWIVNESNRD